ncbi:hypothetical protein E4U55_004961 [Claviceps digitariae]|nr:hypothetical protein E4U55_004961 [Claviceps digitariae]
MRTNDPKICIAIAIHGQSLASSSIFLYRILGRSTNSSQTCLTQTGRRTGVVPESQQPESL